MKRRGNYHGGNTIIRRGQYHDFEHGVDDALQDHAADNCQRRLAIADVAGIEIKASESSGRKR